jgi:hypothetical protein
MAIQKNCDVEKELVAARKMAQERKAAQAVEVKKNWPNQRVIAPLKDR